MDYDAVTLDTNTFHRGGLHLEEGIIRQLDQFKDGLTQFVLSEIILRELHKHLKQKHKEANEKISSAIKLAAKVQLIDSKNVEIIVKMLTQAPSMDKAAQNRIEAFMDRTGARSISAESARMKDLIKSYFQALPPFDATGSKKCEFPDAIALLSLECWAESNGKMLLAISADEGWKKYAENSKWIDVQPDLASALEVLQKHSAETREVLKQILAKMRDGGAPDLLEELIDAASDEVASLDYYAEADSAFHYDADTVEAQCLSVEIPEDFERSSYKVVRIGRLKTVFQIDLDIGVRAEADFSFGIYDSEDKDYITIGHCTAIADCSFSHKALITIEGDLNGDISELHIESVELVGGMETVDFGNIEPDYDAED